jgi:hypothetical protein
VTTENRTIVVMSRVGWNAKHHPVASLEAAGGAPLPASAAARRLVGDYAVGAVELGRPSPVPRVIRRTPQ